LNLAIFISVFLILILAFNLGPVRLYGELEFVFGLMKCLLIVGLIFAGLLVDWGANPTGTFIGGKNWHPSPINEYLVTGATGRFLAVWGVLSRSDVVYGDEQRADAKTRSQCRVRTGEHTNFHKCSRRSRESPRRRSPSHEARIVCQP
jgi:L-asparagine transporter-like permease